MVGLYFGCSTMSFTQYVMYVVLESFACNEPLIGTCQMIETDFDTLQYSSNNS